MHPRRAIWALPAIALLIAAAVLLPHGDAVRAQEPHATNTIATSLQPGWNLVG